jgi:hypothetical protein
VDGGCGPSRLTGRVTRVSADPPNRAFDRLTRGIGLELRQFVRVAGRRRMLPFTAYVGVPGGHRARFVEDVRDPVLRADLVERGVDSLAPGLVEKQRACAWVTRADGLDPETRDLEWLAAARAGFARHVLELPAFFVVGRYGWHELLSGRTRTWSRIRSSKVHRHDC